VSEAWAAETALKGRLSADLRAAMKARDTWAVAAIRTLAAAIDNAGAVPVAPDRRLLIPVVGQSAEAARRNLSDADLAAIVERERVERERAIVDYEAGGQTEAADRLRYELAVIARYA
jgi:uncharacterized protein YqeY